jgi:hypothetical protein
LKFTVNFLKQFMAASGLLLVSATACAQYLDAPLDGRAGFLVGYGFTWGGDKLNDYVRSGRGTALVIGAEYRFNRKFSVQINGSLHTSDYLFLDTWGRTDKTDTSPNNVDSNGRPLYCNNGSCQEQFGKPVRDYDSGTRFNRTPVELLAHVFVSEQIRIGGGVRTIRGANFNDYYSSKITRDESLGNSNGGVLELEVFDELRKSSIKLRVANDRFKTSTRGSVNSGNLGLYFSAYFL